MARFVTFAHVDPDEPPVAVNPEHVVAIQFRKSNHAGWYDGYHLLLSPGDTGLLVRHDGDMGSIKDRLSDVCEG